ncbi:MAG TPA: hypothetical protein DEW10_04290 [Bifidobacterium sp.]|nr:hypothetical protein [Bifidobacterium sp.]HCH21984.1 hypothetical protein [Bifidobacterium sp.]
MVRAHPERAFPIAAALPTHRRVISPDATTAPRIGAVPFDGSAPNATWHAGADDAARPRNGAVTHPCIRANAHPQAPVSARGTKHGSMA